MFCLCAGTLSASFLEGVEVMSLTDPSDGDRVMVPAGQLTKLLAAVKQSNEQIQQLKEEIVKSKDEAKEAIAKRLKKERKLNFKSKGNKVQHETNEEVLDKLEAAVSGIEKAIADPGNGEASLEKTVEILNEGKSLLATRQKHIRIADRSEHGWNTVMEYEADELASDSDDEKKLEKAEKAADRKAQRLRKRKQDFQSWKAKRQRSFAPDYGQQSAAGGPLGAGGQFFNSMSAGQRGSASASLGAAKPIGPCFHCLQMGHLRRNCPKLASSSTVGKWYPFSEACGCSAEERDIEGESKGIVRKSNGGRESGEESDGGEESGCWHVVKGQFPGCLDVRVSCLLGQPWGGFSGQQVSLEEGCHYVIPAGGLEPCRVKGSLRKHLDFWVDALSPSPTVIGIIKEGYKLPLFQVPPNFYRENDRSVFECRDFVDRAVVAYYVCIIIIH